MKILLICGVFPPQVSAIALLLDKLLPYLQAQGVEVDGLTVKESFSDSDFYTYNGMKVHRANCVLNTPVKVAGIGDFCYKASKRLRRVFVKQETPNFYRKEVTKGLVAALKRLDPEQYDCIVSVCAYYDAAVALMEYKKRYGMQTPIVLYQLDPLAENPIYADVADVDAYEKKLYGDFNCVLTTPIIYKAKEAKGWPMDRVISVDQPVALADRKETNHKDEKIIKCLYAGYLYGGLRDAGFTLDLFSKMRDPRIHLYMIGRGQEALICRYAEGLLKGRLHSLGEMNSEECDRFIQDADILVNIGNTDPMFVPSKLLHYIGFGKPILDVVACENCPTIPYLEKYRLARSVRDTSVADSDCVKEVEDWICNHLSEQVSQEEIRSAIGTCMPEFIAKQIVDAVKRCTTGS